MPGGYHFCMDEFVVKVDIPVEVMKKILILFVQTLTYAAPIELFQWEVLAFRTKFSTILTGFCKKNWIIKRNLYVLCFSRKPCLRTFGVEFASLKAITVTL